MAQRQRPDLQYSIAVSEVLHLPGMPESIHPLMDIETQNAFPNVRLRFSILNGWVNGEGEWHFETQIVLPFGERPPELRAAHVYKFVDHEDLFLEVMPVDYVFPIAGTYWIAISCDGTNVLSYPLRIYQEGHEPA